MTECHPFGGVLRHTSAPMPLPTTLHTALAISLLTGLALPVRAEPEAPADYADRVLATVNHYRESKGLLALRVSPRLSLLAAQHSAAMAAVRKPSHNGFADRFDRSGADLCVENVAHGFRIPEQVIIGWRKVATHHRNLLEPRVGYVGLANHGLFITYFACDIESP